MNALSIISALLTAVSFVSSALGHPAVGAVVNDPTTAANIQTVITGITGLISAFTPAVHQVLNGTAPKG